MRLQIRILYNVNIAQWIDAVISHSIVSVQELSLPKSHLSETQGDMKELVEYGRLRVVKIMIEHDISGHSASWCVCLFA